MIVKLLPQTAAQNMKKKLFLPEESSYWTKALSKRNQVHGKVVYSEV